MRHLYNGDSWVVLSPMRTGSFLLANSISMAYKKEGVILKWMSPQDTVWPVRRGEIWHCHSQYILGLLHPETQLIISARDPIESAISFIKAERYGTWHLTDAKLVYNIMNSVPSYHIDPQYIIQTIDRMCEWYETLTTNISNIRYTLVDYKEFSNGDLTNVHKKLDIPLPVGAMLATAKTPGTNNQWIENWKEIEEVINTYDKSRYLSLPYFSN
jgi:LPS sulfotransferase NodH